MITFPPDDALVLREAPHFDIRPTVQLVNLIGSGEQVDLTDRLSEEGGFDIAASQDNACGTASVTFERDGGSSVSALSLSPLVSFSSARFSDGRPFFDPGVAVRISVACQGIVPSVGPLPLGGTPVLIFYGRLDRANIAAGEDLLRIQCRDFGAYLLNATIPEAELRGDEMAEDVISHLVQDYSPTPMAFTSEVPSDFFIEPYAQQEGPALEACRIIAQQRGWDCRWFTGGTSLRLYEPRRFAVLPDVYLDPWRYERVTELELADDDVRNKWRLYWQDADGLIQGPIDMEDADSIARYGTRFARIYVNRAENIRNEDAGVRFLAAALADSKDPFVTHAIQAPFLPEVELGDLHSYTGREYFPYLSGAVTTYSHSYRRGHATTTIGARPRALAAYRDYRRSVPPKTIITTQADPTYYAPEGTVVLQVESLAFPV